MSTSSAIDPDLDMVGVKLFGEAYAIYNEHPKTETEGKISSKQPAKIDEDKDNESKPTTKYYTKDGKRILRSLDDLHDAMKDIEELRSQGLDPDKHLKFKTLSLQPDPRFPNVNQTRRCWQLYIDWLKCLRQETGDFDPSQDVEDRCGVLRRASRIACPAEWIDRWEEAREEEISPHVDSLKDWFTRKEEQSANPKDDDLSLWERFKDYWNHMKRQE